MIFKKKDFRVPSPIKKNKALINYIMYKYNTNQKESSQL